MKKLIVMVVALAFMFTVPSQAQYLGILTKKIDKVTQAHMTLTALANNGYLSWYTESVNKTLFVAVEADYWKSLNSNDKSYIVEAGMLIANKQPNPMEFVVVEDSRDRRIIYGKGTLNDFAIQVYK